MNSMILLGIFLILVFLYSLVSKRARSTVFSAPMVFTGAGIILAPAFPVLSQESITDKAFLVLGEITLALIIFSEATHINLRQVMREHRLPSRLLGIGMPLIILAGTIVAVLLFSDLSIWEAAILATILAPTDPSLGIGVVTSRRVPALIRQALSLESGLNDGLSVPLLMLFIALARVESPITDGSWVVYFAQQIGFGLLVGLIIGWLGGWVIAKAERRDWMTDAAQQLALLSIAILSWWLAEKVIGGNGFVAAFIAGTMVRRGFESAGERMAELSEAWGDLLIFGVFFLFGTVITPDLGDIDGSIWLYAILSLTIVRMLPVALAMIGTKLQPSSVAFLGWFGPRGLSSVVLGLVYLKEEVNLPGESTILLATIGTVLLSILAHGVTSAPGVALYAQKVEQMEPETLEVQAVVETSSFEKVLIGDV
jgi:NhaP-type Na+/H+ or K+/H+ antiporter